MSFDLLSWSVVLLLVFPTQFLITERGGGFRGAAAPGPAIGGSGTFFYVICITELVKSAVVLGKNLAAAE